MRSICRCPRRLVHSIWACGSSCCSVKTKERERESGVLHRAGTFDLEYQNQIRLRNVMFQGRCPLSIGPQDQGDPAAFFSLVHSAFLASSSSLAYLSARVHHREDAHKQRRRGCGYSPNSPVHNQGRRLRVLTPAGNSGLPVWIAVCAAFLVTYQYRILCLLKPYLTTNIIPVAGTMMVQVHGRPQHAHPETLKYPQHPTCPPGGVRVQNLCMLETRSHVGASTKATGDIIMHPKAVSVVYLGTRFPLPREEWMFCSQFEAQICSS